MKTVVEIEWDTPEEQQWLCADNIAIALHQVCTNTRFKVKSLDNVICPKKILTAKLLNRFEILKKEK